VDFNSIVALVGKRLILDAELVVCSEKK
jgi:hypothetical protein